MVEDRERDEQNIELTKSEEVAWRDYSEYLEVTAEMLRDKIILDVGAGTRMFAAAVIDLGLTDQVYSLEKKIKGPAPMSEEFFREAFAELSDEVKRKIDDKTIVASYTNIPLPDESMDYCFVKSATPGGKWYGERDKNEQEKQDEIDKAIGEFVRVLKPGGEVRLWPGVSLFENPKIEELIDTGNYAVSRDGNLLVISKLKKEDGNFKI